MLTNDEYHTSAMVDAVRDMSRKLESSECTAAAERTALRAGIDATIAAMRRDFHHTIAALQLATSQHQDEHNAERSERAADSINRSNRQFIWDLWMGALTTLGMINLGLALYLAFQAAQ